MNREEFESELAIELAKLYPAGAEAIRDSLKRMRTGDSYASTSVTGNSMALAAKWGWWAWKQSRAVLVEEITSACPETDEDDGDSEHAIQNKIRNSLAGKCLLFRANVGTAWTGDVKKLPGRRVLIENARPFNTGLPPGFSDTFGLASELVTPEWYARMKGRLVAIFIAPEVKTATGRVSVKQAAFIKAVNDNGGKAGIVRSAEDALALISK